jgi:hypothetical protein
MVLFVLQHGASVQGRSLTKIHDNLSENACIGGANGVNTS